MLQLLSHYFQLLPLISCPKHTIVAIALASCRLDQRQEEMATGIVVVGAKKLC